MEYRITKDSGVWWESTDEVESFDGWGVSQNQEGRAKKVAPGDVLLHFIDSARAWAGYSHVTASMKPNDRDSHSDWRAALPFVIPITKDKWLNREQCFLTVSIEGLSGKSYHRQQTFTIIQPDDAQLIIAAINEAAGKSATPSSDFLEKWNRDAEQFYWEIIRNKSGGKCYLCGMTAEKWVCTHNLRIPEADVQNIRERFLDMAHIEAKADQGKMSPDNIGPLCPNCHRIVDRIPPERRKALLQIPKPQS